MKVITPEKYESVVKMLSLGYSCPNCESSLDYEDFYIHSRCQNCSFVIINLENKKFSWNWKTNKKLWGLFEWFIV